MEHLQADVNTQNWSAIFDLTEPDEQLQHFNQITLWLLDLHALLTLKLLIQGSQLLLKEL
jgi:hypothetical protein